MANKKIYLDNCCYNRPFDDQNQIDTYLESRAKMYIQELIENNKVDLVISFISVYENEKNPYPHKRNPIRDFFTYAKTNVSGSSAEQVINLLDEITKSGIKEKDAMHIACAIIAKSDYLITTDKRVLKYKTNKINIINPVNFVQEWTNINKEKNYG